MKKIFIVLLLFILIGCHNENKYQALVIINGDIIPDEVYTSASSYSLRDNKLYLYSDVLKPITVTLEKSGYETVNFIISTDDLLNKNYSREIEFGSTQKSIIEVVVRTSQSLDMIKFSGIDLEYVDGKFVGKVPKNSITNFVIEAGDEYRPKSVQITLEDSANNFIYKEVVLVKNDERILRFRYPYGQIGIIFEDKTPSFDKYNHIDGVSYVIPINTEVRYRYSPFNKVYYYKANEDKEIFCNTQVDSDVKVTYRLEGSYLPSVRNNLYYEYDNHLFKMDVTTYANIPVGSKIVIINTISDETYIRYLEDYGINNTIHIEDSSFGPSIPLSFDVTVYDILNKEYVTSLINNGSKIEALNNEFISLSIVDLFEYNVMNNDIYVDMKKVNGTYKLDLFVTPNSILFGIKFVDIHNNPLEGLIFNTIGDYIGDGVYSFPYMNLNYLDGAFELQNSIISSSLVIQAQDRIFNVPGNFIAQNVKKTNINGIDYYVFEEPVIADVRHNNIKIKYESANQNEQYINTLMYHSIVEHHRRFELSPLTISYNYKFINNAFVGDVIKLVSDYFDFGTKTIVITEEMMYCETIYLNVDDNTIRLE